MPHTEQEIDPEFAAAVREAVVGLGAEDTRVVDARLERTLTWAAEPAWRVVLVLPEPRGRTWDVERSLELRRRARSQFDRVAVEWQVVLEGRTSVELTVQGSAPGDAAGQESAEPGEGVARSGRPAA